MKWGLWAVGAWLGTCAAISAQAPAATPLRVATSPWYAAALREALPRELGRAVEVVETERLLQPAMPGASATVDPNEAATAHWFVDEWTLSRLAHARGSAALDVGPPLPFAVEYVLLAAPELGPSRIRTWEELALEPALHDRLAVPDPTLDGGPWAAMLLDAIERGAGLGGAQALWTTVDARAAAEAPTGLRGIAAVQAGRLVGVVVPAGPSLRIAEAASLARHPIAGHRARLGIAVTGDAGPWREALAGLDEQAWRRLAAAVGLEIAAAGSPPLPGDLAESLWRIHQTEVQGRGRGLEELADGLDLVFALGSLVVLVVVWRRLAAR